MLAEFRLASHPPAFRKPHSTAFGNGKLGARPTDKYRHTVVRNLYLRHPTKLNKIRKSTRKKPLSVRKLKTDVYFGCIKIYSLGHTLAKSGGLVPVIRRTQLPDKFRLGLFIQKRICRLSVSHSPLPHFFVNYPSRFSAFSITPHLRASAIGTSRLSALCYNSAHIRAFVIGIARPAHLL